MQVTAILILPTGLTPEEPCLGLLVTQRAWPYDLLLLSKNLARRLESSRLFSYLYLVDGVDVVHGGLFRAKGSSLATLLPHAVCCAYHSIKQRHRPSQPAPDSPLLHQQLFFGHLKSACMRSGRMHNAVIIVTSEYIRVCFGKDRKD